MPVVDYEGYCKMLNKAYKEHYAYPAFNVSNMETACAVLIGLSKAKSDGIIQVSIGGGAHASGSLKDSVLGAIAISDYVRLIAQKFDVNVALHTDHCQSSKIESFLVPLIEETEKRRKKGLCNIFNSHMFDGSDISLEKNLEISRSLLQRCAKNEIVLEVEVGVVGGEEDGINNEGVFKEKLYSSAEDILKVYEALNEISDRYMVAATFGNVHGVYKPGNVKLRPKVLLQGKEAIEKKYGENKGVKYVFHGGSGSSQEEIRETLKYGVVKMNIDTDTQYAFTRPIVDFAFKNYDGILKVDGEVGVKSIYDPRKYMLKAMEGMAKRVLKACEDLKSFGSHINL